MATEAFGGYGGIAQSTCDLLSALSSMTEISKIEILPRLAPGGERSAPDRIRQHAPRPGRLSYALGASALVRSVRPQVIYCGHVFMVPLAAALARRFGAKLVAHLHGLELTHGNFGGLRRIGLEQADLALCVSRDTQAKVLAGARLPRSRTEVIYNTYGPSFTPGDRAAARRRFGLEPDAFVLLTVSRLDARQRHKGHDMVLDALAARRTGGRKLTYLIAGSGDDRPRLEARSHDLGLGDIVRFVGRVAEEALPDLYRAADLFVMPSTGEGFGIAFVEAMACGTPALGLDAGGAADALVPGELGVAATPETFADALYAQLSAPAIDRAALASKVRRRFGAAAFEARVDAAFSRLLGDAGSAAGRPSDANRKHPAHVLG